MNFIAGLTVLSPKIPNPHRHQWCQKRNCEYQKKLQSNHPKDGFGNGDLFSRISFPRFEKENSWINRKQTNHQKQAQLGLE